MTSPAQPVALAVSRLLSPDATERYSPLTGEALLVVDLGAEGGSVGAEPLARAREALLRLPAPSIGLRGAGVSPAGAALADRFDVVVAGDGELALLRERIARRPLASMALVQLLRHTEGRDTEAGLFAESLVYSTLQAGPEFGAWLARRGPAPPAPADAAPPLRVCRELDRLHLRLHRPERHNAFSSAMRDALCEALELALFDDSLACVVLSGEGPSFCSGGDLDEFGTLPDPATAHAIRSTRSAARLVAACGPRLRAELHGACIGAGIELPAFAAEVNAREDAFFELPELALGLVPGSGGSVSLPRRIGRQRTAWLALSGSRIDAATARAWGLVDAVHAGAGDEA
jgi:enoyl-CoA hydratase/carnithine racemase